MVSAAEGKQMEQAIQDQLLNNDYYVEHGGPHELWAQMRAHAPVAWIEVDNIAPFWALTRHADIIEVASQPEVFINAPRPFIMNKEVEIMVKNAPVKSPLQLDPPVHNKIRKIVSSWFTPRNLKKIEERIHASADRLVDRMAENGTWEGDFVMEIAGHHPLDLIAALLGLDDEGTAFAMRLANEIFGGEDPEFQTQDSYDAHMATYFMDAIKFFNDLADSRRKNPTDDLASVIANATVDGEPISIAHMFGLFIILMAAGHETVRTAMSSGLVAMINHPEEIERWKNNPEIGTLAADEIVRWTTPVNTFGRTATRDYELRGKTIKEGEAVCMFYGSGNRDEEVFEDPYTFKLDRTPNPHLGFGKGQHFCLGATLARMELYAFFPALFHRMKSIELVTPPENFYSNFIVGPKHVPLQITF